MRKRLFVSLFFLIAILPLAANLAGFGAVGLVNENRNLAAAPSFGPMLSIEHATRSADAWFTDHFGLRSVLIRIKTQLDYTFFGTSSRVHIGHNGWMFYRSVMDVEKPNVEAYLKTDEAKVVNGIRAFAAALDGKGIKLLISINLLADRFVPEQLPSSRPNLPQPPRIDSLISKIATLENVSYIDATAIQKRLGRSTFHKTDFHWNDPAAFEVAKEIVERIGVLDGRAPGTWRHALVIEEKVFSGGIATYMPVFRSAQESGLFVKLSASEPVGIRHIGATSSFEFGTIVEPPQPALLPTTVVVSNSFFDGMTRSGIYFYFNEMWRIRWANTTVSSIAKDLPPGTRYVLVQFIEVSLGAIKAFADDADIAKAVAIIGARPMN
jgi:hypothetical protein